MSVFDKLKVDPLNYVTGLESPIGIYLRREMFTKETEADRALKRELYEKTVADQSTDGSWGRKEQENATFLALDPLKNAFQ